MLEAIAQFLEREAGHVLIGFAVLLTGVAINRFAGLPQEGRDLIVAGSAYIARSMGTAVPGAIRAIKNS